MMKMSLENEVYSGARYYCSTHVIWSCGIFFSVGQVNGKVCNLMQNQATHTEKYAGPFLLKFCRSGELSYLHNFFFLTH